MSDRFEDFRKSYPSREGTQRWPQARRFATSLVARGEVTWDELVDAAERYKTFCRIKGSIGGPYVLQAATFLNSAGGWMEEWTPPRPEGPVVLTEEQKREQALVRQAAQEGLTRAPGESLDSFSDRIRRAYIARVATPAEPTRQPAAPFDLQAMMQKAMQKMNVTDLKDET